jgi:hypothetical protein
MKGIFYTLTVVFLVFSCKPVEPTTENTANTKRYAIGKGGGFTGAYTEYILEENGKVYKYDFKYDREVFTKNLGKADLIYFMEKINALGLEGIEINEPGNMSYYIDVRTGKNSINKITWGANLYYAPQELVSLHKELFNKLAEIE